MLSGQWFIEFQHANLCDFLKESLEEGVDPLLGGVHWAVVTVLLSPVVVALRQQAGLPGLKRLQGEF